MSSDPQRKNAQVLIVDDEPNLCWALENLLASQGLSSRTAFTAGEALALTKRQRFQLVLLDVKLEDMDGFELAQHIREADPGIAIVIVSGYTSKSDAVVTQAQTDKLIAGCISKPFRHDELLSLVRSCLDLQPPGEQGSGRIPAGN